MSLSSIFTWLGILTAGAVTAALVDGILPFLRPSKLGRYLHTKDGKPAWAFVTGASDGIGKAISHELAAKGFNVVLHGRNPAKLESVQRHLQATFPEREFRVIIADATNCAPDVFKDIANRLADLHLTVLVSNAGTALTSPDATAFRTLDAFSNNELAYLLSLNAVFPTLLIRAMIPVLARNSPALAISIGSLSDAGLPLIGAYSANKGHQRVLFEAVAREMRIADRDVEVIYMRLGSVTGVSHLCAPPTLFEPHSSTAARAVLARVGCGRAVVVPYWAHALQAVGPDWLPWWLKDAIFTRVMLKMQAEEMSPQRKGTDLKRK